MKRDSKITDYRIRSLVSGKLFDDGGWLLDAPGEAPGLMRTQYARQQLELMGDEYGLYTFGDWLPIGRLLAGSASPVTYRSDGLASGLGLERLFITFSGYWPERGAGMRTCSFKETEAYSVCARPGLDNSRVLVVASAGNTARSFARVCSDNNVPLLLCVPEDNGGALWFDTPLRDCVKLVVTPGGSDYYDAIHLSALVCRLDGFLPEGGAKNIARRDGMGTTVLSAATFIGTIPDYYFQAVGSGTGAIAAWEANLRLIGDGRFGRHKMKLMLSQNAPFHPMADAWEAHSRDLLPMNDAEARARVEQISAKVLSNRRPPYSVTGGLFDALNDCEGEMFIISNDELEHAADLFLATEGIDIHPAAAVAVASLLAAVNKGKVDRQKTIMLNITGGGEDRFTKAHQLHYLQPSCVLQTTAPEEDIKREIRRLF